jgi:hypothetical protein
VAPKKKRATPPQIYPCCAIKLNGHEVKNEMWLYRSKNGDHDLYRLYDRGALIAESELYEHSDGLTGAFHDAMKALQRLACRAVINETDLTAHEQSCVIENHVFGNR